jgi:hypothetical protein
MSSFQIKKDNCKLTIHCLNVPGGIHDQAFFNRQQQQRNKKFLSKTTNVRHGVLAWKIETGAE